MTALLAMPSTTVAIPATSIAAAPTAQLQYAWEHISQLPLFGLFITLVIYQLALFLYQKSNRNILLHPVAVAAVCITLLLHVVDISYQHYVSANALLLFLLGPATVALAIPLYQEFQHLRRLLVPIIITSAVGGVIACGSAVLIAAWLGGSDLTLLSIAPKSVTTPIALAIADSIGALPSLAAGAVLLTGVSATLLSPLAFRLTKLTDPRLQGVVLGINAHAVGTSRAFEAGKGGGAFASLTMGLTGIFTALALPYAVQILRTNGWL